MQFTAFVIAFAASLASGSAVTRDAAVQASKFTSARPVPENFFESHLVELDYPVTSVAEPGLTGRAITHLYVCINSNFTPACLNLETQTGQCVNFINNWNDAISSLGPDAGTSCQIWADINCSGRTLTGIVNPGIYNLADYNFNDITSSYKCF